MHICDVRDCSVIIAMSILCCACEQLRREMKKVKQLVMWQNSGSFIIIILFEQWHLKNILNF